MKSLLALGALLLSASPALADVGPIPVGFTKSVWVPMKCRTTTGFRNQSIATVWAIISMLNMQTKIGKSFLMSFRPFARTNIHH